MKSRIAILITLFCLSLSSKAQKDSSKDLELIKAEPNKELTKENFNRWSIEADFGQARGLKPYTEGYYAIHPGKLVGGFVFNSFGFGARYMFTPKFGIKANINVVNLQEQNNSGSLPYQMEVLILSTEGVANLTRLFDLQNKDGKFGLLFHFGIQVSRNAPQMGPLKNLKERNGGFIFGISPRYRIYKNISAFADLTINSNVSQHLNWDGQQLSDSKTSLTGSMFRTSFGISLALGKGNIHGDWAIIKDKNERVIDSLNNRIGEIEEMLSDTDKDGVPDYLDAEQNSIAGVAVDSKGRMIDKNNNGISDELEKYVDNSISTNNSNNNNAINAASENAILRLINEGYIAVYFDSEQSQPNSASNNNIGFILNYLKNNPDKSVDIIGYADEVGRDDYNNKLAAQRAQNVKSILVKAGISDSRISVTSNGEDKSVDKKSKSARSLVRKTIFKIK